MRADHFHSSDIGIPISGLQKQNIIPRSLKGQKMADLLSEWPGHLGSVDHLVAIRKLEGNWSTFIIKLLNIAHNGRLIRNKIGHFWQYPSRLLHFPTSEKDPRFQPLLQLPHLHNHSIQAPRLRVPKAETLFRQRQHPSNQRFVAALPPLPGAFSVRERGSFYLRLVFENKSSKMKTTTNYLWAACFLLASACGNAPAKSDKQEKAPPSITIAVAANMQFAMEALMKAFTEKTGVRCETTISSSGKLTVQIKEGAPFDVFVSADMNYPEEIFQSGLAAAPPKIYAYGKLVLWSMKENLTPSLEMLGESSIRHIALANPKLAPYGIAAVETLKNHGLWEQVEKKLVFGESIAQTNQFIITGAAEAGFTALSVVLSDQMKGKGKWIEINQEDYPPIAQGVVVIKRKNASPHNALKFYDFLSSEEASAILVAFGYGVDTGK